MLLSQIRSKLEYHFEKAVIYYRKNGLSQFLKLFLEKFGFVCFNHTIIIISVFRQMAFNLFRGGRILGTV